jgi:hypothetical protein
MEPEIDNIIRKKINAVEEQPVHWNKAGAWSKINGPQKTKPRATYVYYAAATAAFFILALKLVTTQLHKNEIAFRITLLEDRIYQAEANTTSTREPIQTTACRNENMDTFKKSYALNSKPRKISPVLSPIAVATKEKEIVIVSSVEAQKEEIPLQQETVQPEKSSIVATTRIEPIIGVYETETKTESVAKTAKKNRFQWHRPTEINAAEEAHKNTFLLARIK